MTATTPHKLWGERFELIGELGSGGAAVVYLAWDRVREERVALKLLHPHLHSDRLTRTRLRREVQAAGRIRHPNALVAFELHEVDGQLALSMPLHTGVTLAEAVSARGPLEAEALTALATQLAGALGASHRAGVIHRDVSPNNILVDEDGTACLSDFGLARLEGQRTGTATTIMGTWGYAAPELFEGRRVDPRADLYGLGAVLYLAATGRAPFEGPTPAAVLRLQVEGSHERLTEVRPDLPRPLCALVDRLLEVRPEDRPASVGAVLDALERPSEAVSPAPQPARVEPELTHRSHLPPGTWRVEVAERGRYRGRRRELRRQARRRQEGRLDAHVREALLHVGVELRRGLGLPLKATPEEELARAVARAADLPPEALEVTPAMLERRFELTRGVSEEVALRLATAARGAGFRARVAPDGEPIGGERGRAVLAIMALLLSFPAALALLSMGGLYALLGLLLPLLLLRVGLSAAVRLVKEDPESLPLAYGPDLRPALANGYTHLLSAPKRRVAMPAPPSPPAVEAREPLPPQRPPLHQRAVDAIDALNSVLLDHTEVLAAPMIADLEQSVAELRTRADALAERIASLEQELAGVEDPAGQAAALRIEARLERLRTLERAGALADPSEIPQLERALEAHHVALEKEQDLEDALTLATAHILEVAATATAARRDLLADHAVDSLPLVIQRLKRESKAAASALQEVGGGSRAARGARQPS